MSSRFARESQTGARAHWGEQEFIQHIYGVGPEGPEASHLGECPECRNRLQAMRLSRAFVEAQDNGDGDLTTDFLAAQRRAIYARLSRRDHWLPVMRKWTAAACMLVIAAFAAWEFHSDWRAQTVRMEQQAKVSDAQLAEDVGRMSADVEPDAAAPLQALFQD